MTGYDQKEGTVKKLHSKGASYIHLIRHGVTEGNKKKWFYGSSDLPLSEEGIVELKKLAAEGLYPQHDRATYYTSVMVRTIETLEAIYGQTEYTKIDDLREYDFGEFERKTYDEIKDNELFQEWLSDKSGDILLPGGETCNAFFERTISAFKEIVDRHRIKELSQRHAGDDVHSVVVCHGGVISSIMMYLFSVASNQEMYKWIPDPGHGFTLEIKDGEVAGYTRF